MRDNNILDLVLSNCKDLVSDLKVGLELSTSDHRLITLKVKMINEFSDLEELVATEKFDIIAITESWLNTKDRDFLAEYNLHRYSIFSCDRENRSNEKVPDFRRADFVELRSLLAKFKLE